MTPDTPFIRRVFTSAEIDYCFSHHDASPHLAAIFAAKEAVVKTLGSGDVISYRTVEILHDDAGVPSVHLPGHNIYISLSHSRTSAIAFAVRPCDPADIPPTMISAALRTAEAQLLNEE